MHDIALSHRFTITALIAAPEPLVDRGDRLDFIPITGGTVSGDLTGEVVPGGGDWCCTRSDGVVAVEARYLVRTASGALVDVHNTGVLRPSDVGDDGAAPYFLTTPRFRTVDPALHWLTAAVFVGEAHVEGDRVVIEVAELVVQG
ncbi:Protein of unknown function [Quadrisphaera granulorum]|uniref:Uncharacterized protein DUF3237 n=1 Tax=Quadrisphaera granulorum TaxID=317664 RepID=A0A316AXH9_9ACTN|nr:DUF3237 domain-containing protein [Quadrisphaera granulorum]PWJ54907.1 uncharacterized protein DUF3237 [Quadrisphaera granulorum]SZE95853.1 Protein of unknown function [Quadrisphaera granulorum]